MVKVAVVYHEGCPDGWGAAWVAYRALVGRGDGVPVLVPASHGGEVPDLGEFGTVYVVDFSFSHDVLRELGEARRVVVLDHHQTAVDDICAGHGDFPGEGPWGDGSKGDEWVVRYDRWYETVLDTNRSGAGITWDYFHPGEARPVVVDYVEDRDLWRFALPNSKAVSAFIRCQPHTIGAWDDIDQYLGVGDMARAGDGVQLHIDAYCRAAASHAYWCQMGGRRFPIVNVTYESCSDVATYLLDRFETDMAGYYFERGDGAIQYGFRSRNGVTVHDHAQEFGGGGHPQAAGCTVGSVVHDRERAEQPDVRLRRVAGGGSETVRAVAGWIADAEGWEAAGGPVQVLAAGMIEQMPDGPHLEAALQNLLQVGASIREAINH